MTLEIKLECDEAELYKLLLVLKGATPEQIIEILKSYQPKTP